MFSQRQHKADVKIEEWQVAGIIIPEPRASMSSVYVLKIITTISHVCVCILFFYLLKKDAKMTTLSNII